MKRNLLGIIALALVVSGAIGLLFDHSSDSHFGRSAGVGLRVGLVLGAFWIALPQIENLFRRVPPWLLGILLVGALVVVVQPKYFMLVIVAVAVLAALQFAGRFLRPPKKRRRRRTDPSHAPPRSRDRSAS